MAPTSRPLFQRHFRGLEFLLATVILALGLIYSLGHILLVPYPGLDYNSQWQIVDVREGCAGAQDPGYQAWCQATQGLLQPNDRILAIARADGTAPRTLEDYNRDLAYVPFGRFRPGDVARLTIQRGDQVLTVDWPLPEPPPGARVRRLAGFIPFLAFWVAGTVVLLFFRPRDLRWQLLVAMNYLTGMWLATGNLSASQALGSVYMTTLLSWLLMPVYLHLHTSLVFPGWERRHRHWFGGLYVLTLVLTGFSVARGITGPYSFLGFLLGILGGLCLLLYRLVRPRPRESRTGVIFMLSGAMLALLPASLFWIVPTFLGAEPPRVVVTGLVTLSISALPFVYIYAIYKHRLGNIEVRANQALALYSFLILYGTAFVLFFLILNEWVDLDSRALGLALGVSAFFLVLALLVQKPFMRAVRWVAYGTRYEPERIVQQFANEIPRALRPEKLAHLLQAQLLPSLLVRQSALYRQTDERDEWLYTQAVPGRLPVPLDEATRSRFEHRADVYLLEEDRFPAPFQWVRLVIALKLDDRILGYWLFGRRDPDDFYPQSDVELLRTLANQVAVALETMHLFTLERRRAEELAAAYHRLQQADRIKGDMIRNMSHELRTPLTIITGYTDLLLAGDAGEMRPEQKELLQIVATRAQELTRRINDILALQRRQLQRHEGQPVDVVAAVRAGAQAAQDLAFKEGMGTPETHPLVLECPDPTPDGPAPLVWADPGRLAQAIENLVQNAIKFSPNGGPIRIRVWLGEHPEIQAQVAEPSAVFIAVSDQGVGIPPEEQENIWVEFYQIDGSATRRFGGAGLGLSVVRQIVESYHGVVWVESQVGQGTTFTVALPRYDLRSEETMAPAG